MIVKGCPLLAPLLFWQRGKGKGRGEPCPYRRGTPKSVLKNGFIGI